MKKATFILMGLFFICTIAGTNNAFSFSINKSVTSPGLIEYVQAREFIKLSFKQFASLTGEKENLWNKLSFYVMKMRVKHDLKKHPELKLSDYSDHKNKMSTPLKILLWIGGILLLLLIIVGLIFGGQKK